jgi:AraC family transcriptional regulator
MPPATDLPPPMLEQYCRSRLRSGVTLGEGLCLAQWVHGEIEEFSLALPHHHRLSISFQGEGHVWRLLRTRTLQGRSDAANCLIPAGMSTAWRLTGRADELHLYIPHRVFDRIIAATFDRDPALVGFPDRTFFEDESLHRVLAPSLLGRDWKEPANRLEISQSCFLAFTYLVRTYSTAKARSLVAKGGLPPAVRRRIEDYVEAHLASPLTLTELAAAAGLSEFHFARMFKQSTGESPHAFVLRRRIELAKCLLAKRRLPLSRIASTCGFSSQSHFSARFREITSVTPKHYRAVLT